MARGSLRAINDSLQTLAYRAVYRLNDTLVVRVVDGEFVAETRVAMVYTMEEKKSVGWPFVVVVVVLDVLVVYYMIESYPVKKSSAYLFVPYLLWLILATYLNGYILMYN